MTNRDIKKVHTMRMLLFSGVISTPLFFVASIIQMFTRTGFDIRRHAISTLTLGEFGWIQSVNFILTGLLAILAAFGISNFLHGSKRRTWGSLLIGIYGVGMMVAGLFRPDSGLGFPSGAPEGLPTSMSGHAALHSIAFFTAFICLIAACFVFARRFTAVEERGWRAYCILTGLASPLLIILGMSMNMWMGVVMGGAGIIAFGWVSMLTARLRYEAAKKFQL